MAKDFKLICLFTHKNQIRPQHQIKEFANDLMLMKCAPKCKKYKAFVLLVLKENKNLDCKCKQVNTKNAFLR